MATVPLLPGIWRSNTGSLNMLECRKEGVCVGGNASSDQNPFMYCRNHHVGPLCEVQEDRQPRMGIRRRSLALFAMLLCLLCLLCLPLDFFSLVSRWTYSLSSLPLPPSPGCYQLCEPGYALDMGECTRCLTGTFGRVTTFGLIVFSVVPVVAVVALALYFLKVCTLLKRVQDSMPALTRERRSSATQMCGLSSLLHCV